MSSIIFLPGAFFSIVSISYICVITYNYSQADNFYCDQPLVGFLWFYWALFSVSFCIGCAGVSKLNDPFFYYTASAWSFLSMGFAIATLVLEYKSEKCSEPFLSNFKIQSTIALIGNIIATITYCIYGCFYIH